jgi:hypothetical protein
LLAPKFIVRFRLASLALWRPSGGHIGLGDELVTSVAQSEDHFTPPSMGEGLGGGDPVKLLPDHRRTQALQTLICSSTANRSAH